MAKDEKVEQEYLRIKLSRAIVRREKRNYLRKINKKYKGKACDYCGGNMSWCSCCEMWSSNCCIEYGTCQCS